VRGHVKELDRLAELLGDDHDLGLLRHELTHDSTPMAVDLDAVVNLIDHRRMELQTEATHIGERVYAETRRHSGAECATWKAGRALARAPHEQHPAKLPAAAR